MSRRHRATMLGQLQWLRPEEMRWPLAQGEVGLADAVRGMVREMGMLVRVRAVSYTHLTLPTIYSV